MKALKFIYLNVDDLFATMQYSVLAKAYMKRRADKRAIGMLNDLYKRISLLSFNRTSTHHNINSACQRSAVHFAVEVLHAFEHLR